MDSVLDTLLVRKVQVTFHELVQLRLGEIRLAEVDAFHVFHEPLTMLHLILHLLVLAPEFRPELMNQQVGVRANDAFITTQEDECRCRCTHTLCDGDDT